MNYLFDWIEFVIVLAPEITSSSFRLNILGLLCLLQCLPLLPIAPQYCHSTVALIIVQCEPIHCSKDSELLSLDISCQWTFGQQQILYQSKTPFFLISDLFCENMYRVHQKKCIIAICILFLFYKLHFTFFTCVL